MHAISPISKIQPPLSAHSVQLNALPVQYQPPIVLFVPLIDHLLQHAIAVLPFMKIQICLVNPAPPNVPLAPLHLLIV